MSTKLPYVMNAEGSSQIKLGNPSIEVEEEFVWLPRWITLVARVDRARPGAQTRDRCLDVITNGFSYVSTPSFLARL